MPRPAEIRKRAELNQLNSELRAALNAAVGVAGLLASTPLEPEQAEYVAGIRRGTDAALLLLDEMSRHINSEEQPPAVHAWGAPTSDGPAPGSGYRLLLVEDNLINSRVIKRLLERLGHTVNAVSNGREACDAVSNDRFDLVFMDIQMPVMDGLEATRRIRKALPEEDQPWIVALTSAVLPADREACRKAGADDYLGKPVRTEELQRAIQRGLARQAA